MASIGSVLGALQLMKLKQIDMSLCFPELKSLLIAQSLRPAMLEIMSPSMNSKNSTERHTMKDVKESPHSEQQENDMEFSMQYQMEPGVWTRSKTFQTPTALSPASSIQKQENDPASKQVGGTHYQSMAISPSEYITKNNIPWYEGNAIKYISRHKAKGEKQDLLKAIHYLELAIKEHYE